MQKQTTSILILIASLFFCVDTTQAQKLPELIPYRKGDKWGYCDSTKKIIIPTIYQWTGKFVEGHLYKVKKNNKFALIDKKGKLVFQADSGNIFVDRVISLPEDTLIIVGDRMQDFHEGLISIKGDILIPPGNFRIGHVNGNIFSFHYEKESGFPTYFTIDRENKIKILPFLFRETDGYKGETYLISNYNNKFGLFSFLTNQVIADTVYDYIRFSKTRSEMESNQTYMVKQNGKWGVIDEFGKLNVPTIYNTIKFWTDEYIVACLPEKQVVYKLIDKSTYGEYETLHYPCDSMMGVFRSRDFAFVWNKNKMGIVNWHGQEIVPPMYSTIECLADSLFYLHTESNSKSLTLIKITANSGYSIISEGVLRCQPSDDFIFLLNKDQKWGCVDNNGKTILPIEYDYIEHCNSGFIVKQAGKYRIASDQGKISLINYDTVICSVNGFIVKANGKYGMVNKFGTSLIKPEYDLIKDWYMNGLYEISVKGKSGFIKIDAKNKAKQILPCEYDKILLLRDYGNIKVIQNQMEGIFNAQSEQFVLTCNYENLKLYADKDNIIFCDARFQKISRFFDKDGIEIIPEIFEALATVSDTMFDLGSFKYLKQNKRIKIQNNELCQKLLEELTSPFAEKHLFFYYYYGGTCIMIDENSKIRMIINENRVHFIKDEIYVKEKKYDPYIHNNPLFPRLVRKGQNDIFIDRLGNEIFTLKKGDFQYYFFDFDSERLIYIFTKEEVEVGYIGYKGIEYFED